MKSVLFHSQIKLRLEPSLKEALAEAARSEGTALSEMLRRELRGIVAARALSHAPTRAAA